MTDHLPECPNRPYNGERCICDRLRACEQRCDAKRHAEVKAWADLSRDNFDAGYAAGVQAAREAVDGIQRYTVGNELGDLYEQHDGDIVFYADALAAIDALKGVSE